MGSTTAFLSNERLWEAITGRIKAAKHVDAAIAYFGKNGAKLLPLKSGDRLVVDMSVPTVRAGGTDPREVEKLIRRKVQVFTRPNLHAKLIVAGNSMICGSANVSKRSQEVLDEAAVITTDRTAIRRARELIDRLCIEPVRPEYLKLCKGLYRPPTFKGKRGHGDNGKPRATHAKLWLVNLSQASIPESESKRYELGETRAKKLVKDKNRAKTDSFHWAYKPRMASYLEPGDWIIEFVTYDDKSTLVFPPGQLLLIDHYVRNRDSGQERWVFHIELPKRVETISWERFSRATKSLFEGSLSSPRTKAIRDVQIADSLLGLWTASGRKARQ